MKMRTKRVVCQSGITGGQRHLRDDYEDIEEFRGYSRMYGIAKRLGFRSVKAAWNTNPLIEGSVIPSDLRRSS